MNIQELLDELPCQLPNGEKWSGYETYEAIGRTYEPRTIFEFGTLLGFSLIALWKGAAPTHNEVMTLHWIDNGEYIPDSNYKCALNINYVRNKYRPHLDARWHYENATPERLSWPIRRTAYDLVHIDGEHTFSGKIRDLEIAKNMTKLIIVDDYLTINVVREATDMWLIEREELVANTYTIHSLRGQQVIQLR